MKDTTIITVTYKSSHIICDALKNIVNKGYRIIIVDNGSGDDIEGVLQKEYPDSGIELVMLENNCGFSKANNLALKMVKTEFALLLNPDAIMKEESIENLVKCAKKDEKIALAGAIDIKSENPTMEAKERAIQICRQDFKVTNENEDYMSVNFLCGGYVLLKMKIFRKIGFFDENLFLYGEDDELCSRSIKQGYKNALVKNAHSYHKDHSSTKTEGILEKYHLLYKRNWYIGWSKSYLKRKNKIYPIIFIKALIQLFSTLLPIAKLDIIRSIVRLGRSTGSISNLLGIDCFNKNNKVPKIDKIVKI